MFGSENVRGSSRAADTLNEIACDNLSYLVHVQHLSITRLIFYIYELTISSQKY